MQYVSQVRKVYERISPILKSIPAPLAEKKRSQRHQIRDWIAFAKQYGKAAALLDELPDPLELPRGQLFGHAIECALKAFFTAKGKPTPKGSKGHNLVAMAIEAEEFGCRITELQAIAIVQLSSEYFQDIATESKFKTRYPLNHPETRASIVGSFDELRGVVESICTQSQA
jgi:hypothetical protein